MNSLPKYVLTRGSIDLGWANSHVVGTDDPARLKSEADRPIALFAGARAAQLALEAGEVDELRLIRCPVILGSGTPLFTADGRRRGLTLIETRAYASGLTLTRCAVE